jgi:hypothetical protein
MSNPETERDSRAASQIDRHSSAQKNRTPTKKLVVSGRVEPEGEFSNFWEDVLTLISM